MNGSNRQIQEGALNLPDCEVGDEESQLNDWFQTNTEQVADIA